MRRPGSSLAVGALLLGATSLAGCGASGSPASGAARRITSTTATRTTSTTAGTATSTTAATATSSSTTTSSVPRVASPSGSATVPGLVSTGVGWSPSGLQGPMPPPGACHYRVAADGYLLRDATCTPGAIDTAVTQADIASTICSAGYGTSVRPPESLTEPAKYASMAAYGAPGSASGYEYDHLVPLELGGSSDVRNLWPEPDTGSPSQFDTTDDYGQNAKDGVEDRLNAAVCSGEVTLAAAQRAIATNWTTAETVLGVVP